MKRTLPAIVAATILTLAGFLPAFGAPPMMPTREDPFIKEVNALPAEDQVSRVMAKLKQMNRGFAATETHQVEDGKVTAFSLSVASGLAQITPVHALVNLRKFECAGSATAWATLDLKPLHGLPLCELRLGHVMINDLRPLNGLPLQILTLEACRVPDLMPLKGMRLKRLNLWSTPVTSLAPLSETPLEWLNCSNTKVHDLTPLKGAPLAELYCDNADVSDLAALEGMPLRVLRCDVKAAKHSSKVLQSIKTLEKINNMPAEDFLKTVKSR